MNIEQARFNMIEQQIRTWEVLDSEVLSLLSQLKREEFVPAAHRSMAFVDTDIPLPGGRALLSPKLEARLVQELAVRPQEKVLLIGAATGYIAALLARQAKQVTALDADAALLDLARSNLDRAGIGNVALHTGDGAQGWPADAPFDAILMAGSVASVPQTLLNQLKPGGRLIAVVGQLPIMQAVLCTCVAPGECRRTNLFDTVAPRLAGFDEPSRFKF